MDVPASPSEREPSSEATQGRPRRAERWRGQTLLQSLFNQMISGLIVTLPIVITVWIVYWIFTTIQSLLLNPTAKVINFIHAWMINSSTFKELELPLWWYNVASPALAIVIAIGILYGSGLFFQSWIYRTLDWFLLHVPVVATIYRAVRNVVNSLGTQLRGGSGFKRVVLVEFPHPGVRSLGFVTNSLRDATTGRNILTVCVLTGVMPPAGFTLFVPEESVINIAWSANDSLQAIMSGGITAPPTIHFFEGLSTPLPVTGGPLVDVQGHTLRSVPVGDDGDPS